MNGSAAEKFGVLLRELMPFFRKVIQREDRGNGANRYTRAAIDALHGIDVKHFDVRKSRVFLLGMNAVDGAGVNTCRVLRSNAGFRNYVCHMSGNFKRTIRPAPGETRPVTASPRYAFSLVSCGFADRQAR